MTRRGRWGGVVAALVGALCLSGCHVRLDLGVIGRPNGHLDVLVTVQADDDVRSALMRTGRLEGLTSDALAARLTAWEAAPGGVAASRDELMLALVAADVAPQDAARVVDDLVVAVGLGADVLTLDVRPVGGDARLGLDATVAVGVPELSALEGGTIAIDEDRWVEAMAAVDDAVTASVWIALAGAVDVDASNRASQVRGEPAGGGLVWPVAVGQPAMVSARPAGASGPPPWLLVVAGLVVGLAIGLLTTRRRRRTAPDADARQG